MSPNEERATLVLNGRFDVPADKRDDGEEPYTKLSSMDSQLIVDETYYCSLNNMGMNGSIGSVAGFLDEEDSPMVTMVKISFLGEPLEAGPFSKELVLILD